MYLIRFIMNFGQSVRKKDSCTKAWVCNANFETEVREVYSFFSNLSYMAILMNRNQKVGSMDSFNGYQLSASVQTTIYFLQ